MDDESKPTEEGQSDQFESGPSMTLHLQIPNSLAGSIIGKQGETIKAIREQSHAKVTIGDAQTGEDRDVTIKGSLQSVDQAVNLIIANIYQVKGQTFTPDQTIDDTISIKMLVANDQAGAIIGKGGEVIKQLREETEAKILIGKRVDFVRTISITGNVNAVRAALSVLIRLIHDHPSNARDPFLQGFRANATSRMPQTAFGYPYTLTQAAQVVTPGVTIDSSQFSADPTTAAAAGTTSLTLSVPNGTVGAIIGKRGQTINEIRAVSGCRIDIANQTEGSQFRTITLTGTAHSIEVAHLLIQRFTFSAPYSQ